LPRIWPLLRSSLADTHSRQRLAMEPPSDRRALLCADRSGSAGSARLVSSGPHPVATSRMRPLQRSQQRRINRAIERETGFEPATSTLARNPRLIISNGSRMLKVRERPPTSTPVVGSGGQRRG
jgi:hypothetical protein